MPRISRKKLFVCLVFLLAASFRVQADEGNAPLPVPEAQAQELFNSLDLSSDSLHAVREAATQRQYTEAIHGLAEYYRHRSTPPLTLKFPPPQQDPSFQDPVASDAVKGRVQGGYVPLWHQFPDGKIDWHYDATRATPGEPPNNEWQWQLCRMYFWDNLKRAYQATGDERYARAWVEQFRSFIAQCPPPFEQQNGPGSAWRTLEAGIRMADSWTGSFEVFLSSPAFTDDDLALFLFSSLQHARYLVKFRTTGNWLASEMGGLYTVGALFPEFKEARAWRAAAIAESYAQEKEQFLPDGAQFELSTGYHHTALEAILTIPALAKKAGREGELPPDYVQGIEKGYDFELFLMAPDRILPNFNDSHAIKMKGALRHALDFFPDRKEYQWVVSDGKEGSAPAETSHAFHWAGYFAMRSGWQTDANYLAFRAGPLGYGHGQQDKLDVVAWAYGRELLYSAGGGNYEQSPWRAYAGSSFSHNCVVVDGKSQRQQTDDRLANVSRAALDARWESTADHDFVAGIYDKGYGAVDNRIATQTRRILFVKPDLFVVADTLVPNDKETHTYQARWQLLSTQIQLDKTTKTIATEDGGLPNLAVIPLLADGLDVKSASAQAEPEILGWRIETNPKRVPATTVLHTRKGVGPQSFLTLLLPLRAGDANPVQSVQPTGPGAARVVLTDGRHFDITADPDPSGAISFAEIRANGSSGRLVSSTR